MYQPLYAYILCLGEPRRNRTCNLLIKSQLLCLIELAAHVRTPIDIIMTSTQKVKLYNPPVACTADWQRRMK